MRCSSHGRAKVFASLKPMKIKCLHCEETKYINFWLKGEKDLKINVNTLFSNLRQKNLTFTIIDYSPILKKNLLIECDNCGKRQFIVDEAFNNKLEFVKLDPSVSIIREKDYLSDKLDELENAIEENKKEVALELIESIRRLT